jgi:hypothetical protein
LILRISLAFYYNITLTNQDFNYHLKQYEYELKSTPV